MMMMLTTTTTNMLMTMDKFYLDNRGGRGFRETDNSLSGIKDCFLCPILKT